MQKEKAYHWNRKIGTSKHGFTQEIFNWGVFFPKRKTLNFSTILPNSVNHAHSLMCIKYNAFLMCKLHPSVKVSCRWCFYVCCSKIFLPVCDMKKHLRSYYLWLGDEMFLTKWKSRPKNDQCLGSVCWANLCGQGSKDVRKCSLLLNSINNKEKDFCHEK